MMIRYEVYSVEVATPFKDKEIIVTVKLTPIDQKYPRNFSDITLILDKEQDDVNSMKCGDKFELKKVTS